MSQTALVKRIIAPGVAEVSLMRQLECSLSCANCEGCPQLPKQEVLAQARNTAGAAPGDVVEVESSAGNPMWIALLVYLVPCAALILGYLAGARLCIAEGLRVCTAFAGLLLGFLPAWLINRRISRRALPEFTILSIRR